MSLATNLSTNDQHVLSAIFNQESHDSGETTTSSHSEAVVVDMNMPPDRNLSVCEVEKLVKREKQAIALVEEGGSENMRKSRQIFDEIIKEYPNYASCYNNRAQLRRLDESEKRDDIISDLQMAIKLAQPSVGTTITVSKMQATILCQAYSQLGGIYLEMSNNLGPDQDRWEIEENASNCLYSAGLFGNELAKVVATKVNPYAQLCGNMVREALIAEYSGSN